jgi:Tol biopolymer transport system component
MKRYEKTIIIAIPFVFVVAMVLVSSVRADFTFGEPVNLGPSVNLSSDDALPAISADGLECYFLSDRPGGQGGFDLWVTTRETTDDLWSAAENVGDVVNSASDDGAPTISQDGLSLYFSSNRTGGHGNFDIYVTTRPSKSDPWGQPVNLEPPVNTWADQWASSLSADGLELYFCDWHVYLPGGHGNGDIWLSTRTSVSETWNPPVNLGPAVNSVYFDAGMDISSDGLQLYFGCERPGGYGAQDIWAATRASTSDDWSTPSNLGIPVNSNGYDATPRITSDGSTLFFASTRSGGYGKWDLWQAPIIPIVDFNNDGAVDLDDLILLISHWGTNETLCDIGPFAWGDGMVDIEDLKIFIKYWEQENLEDSPEDQ